MKKPQRKAAIYARVSTRRQIQEGNGIDSQVRTCKDYCSEAGLETEAIFSDGISGSKGKRGGLEQLKTWIRKNKNKEPVIVFDAISRMARDVEVYHQIKTFARRHGASFASPTFNFEESPSGRFLETVTVGAGQFDREMNAVRVKRRQHARLSQGYWCLQAPLGYKSAGKGKPIEPDDLAGVVREALEGFASGRFETKAQVKRFIEAQPEFINTRRSPVLGNGRVDTILRNVLYAG